MGFCKATVRLLLAAMAIGAVTSTPVIYTHPESGEEVFDMDSLEQYTQEEYEAKFGGVDPVYEAFVEEHREDLGLVKRQSTGYTPISGNPGTCQHRRKLEVLQSSFPNEFNIFILALENIQKIKETDELSWFRIMGIHGAPHMPWGQPAQGNYDYSRGYCTHASALFSSWHRPYLLLMEQWVTEKARRIATHFNGTARATYADAATKMRMPYWDWVDPQTQSNIPPVAMQPTIRVIKPNPGQPNPVAVTIPNPLYEYVFKSRELQQQHFFGQFREWTSTRRQPDANGNSRNSEANRIMQSGYTGRRSETYRALGRSTYNEFNNAIEGIHNTIHVNLGGDNGHMTFLDLSAFDPIFMLHHMNVDRMFALWQAAHPGQYLQTTTATATFARNINPNTCGCTDNLGTALFPFHLPNGQWWKTDHIKDARNIWQYGYGYDEVPCSYQGRSSSDLRSFTTQRINQLYGPTQQTGMSAQSVQRVENTDGTNSAQRVGAPVVKKVKKRTDWVARFLIDNAEIPGSWNFHIFVGDAPANIKDWTSAENNLGSISSLGNKLLSSAQMDGKPVMQKTSKLFYKDVPLSEPILAAGLIQGEDEYKESRMVKYLTDKLNWRIEREGEEMDLKNFKTLKVAVYSTEVEYPADDDLSSLPVYGEPKYRAPITKGKVGGISDAKELDNFTLLGGEKASVPALGAAN